MKAETQLEQINHKEEKTNQEEQSLSVAWKKLQDKVTMLVCLLLASPQIAFAQIGEDFIDELVDLTTNVWAVGIATIAVAVVGYYWLFAREIEKKMALRIILGIFFIFGAPTIVDEARQLV